jgi:hypothetical protein
VFEQSNKVRIKPTPSSFSMHKNSTAARIIVLKFLLVLQQLVGTNVFTSCSKTQTFLLCMTDNFNDTFIFRITRHFALISRIYGKTLYLSNSFIKRNEEIQEF